jgi:hypothetical protein
MRGVRSPHRAQCLRPIMSILLILSQSIVAQSSEKASCLAVSLAIPIKPRRLVCAAKSGNSIVTGAAKAFSLAQKPVAWVSITL